MTAEIWTFYLHLVDKVSGEKDTPDVHVKTIREGPEPGAGQWGAGSLGQ
jgi:hypothetical protein